jgi:SAM-dependent methyltransferase
MAAAHGLDATGIDSSPRAIAKANIKASDRNLKVRFVVGDALRLSDLGEQFDTVLDCGVFHVFDDAKRDLYVKSLHAATAPGGNYCMLVFSDRMPGTEGPRRITEAEIRTSFANGWNVVSIEPAILQTIDTSFGDVPAWLAVIGRV